METLHLRMHGRVQGVFLRKHMQIRARELGLTGWVRNNPDGTVECVATGDRAALTKFCDWLRAGPGEARIDKLEAHPLPREAFQSFRVVG